MDVRLRMPQLVLCSGIAMPTEPPIDHRRGNARHGSSHTDPHAAIAGQHKAIFQYGISPEQIAGSLIDVREQDGWHTAPIQRCTNMRGQRRKRGVEEAGIGRGAVCLAIAQIATGNWLAAFHDWRPI